MRLSGLFNTLHTIVNIVNSLTLDNLETANATHPLYSSGFFFTRASMSELAAVTTPVKNQKIYKSLVFFTAS